MKRHPALTDLARDHFHALRCALFIRKAETDQELQTAARELSGLWKDDLIHHFREEEEVLLPILSRRVGLAGNTEVQTMLEDHAYLRDGLRRFCARLEAGELDVSQLRELGGRLDRHARLEDRIVFTLCEERLTCEDLDEVAALSLEFRTQWQRPIGAVKGHDPVRSQTRAAHLIFFVEDQAISRDFYSFVFGIEPRLDQPGMTELGLVPGTVLGLMPRTSASALLGIQPSGPSCELYLVVSHPQRLLERALERGATLLSPLARRDWGASVVYLADPDGNVLAFADRQV